MYNMVLKNKNIYIILNLNCYIMEELSRNHSRLVYLMENYYNNYLRIIKALLAQ